MKKIAVFVDEACWGLSVFTVTDLFRVVTLLERHLGRRPSYRVDLLSVSGQAVRTAGGQVLGVDGPVQLNQVYDWVVLPAFEGGMMLRRDAASAQLVDWLWAMRRQGARFLTLSTGAGLMAESGIAQDAGQVVLATHWAFARRLAQQYPQHQFVTHPSYLAGEVVWSTGSTRGGFDALLDWVAADHGDAFAQLCATHLLMESPDRAVPMLAGRRHHADEAILTAQAWIEAHHAQALTIADMAREVALSECTFKRRFTQATQLSPLVYVQKVRVEKAKRCLLTSDAAIQSIAHEVGYENVSFFVRVFKANTGQTPGQWRAEAAL